MTSEEIQLLELTRQAGSVQVALAHIQQRKMKQINDRLEHCFIEGVGQKIASIHPTFFNWMSAKWGQNWWRDKEFMADTLKKNPFLRVRCASNKIFIRVPDKSGLSAPWGGHGTQGDPAAALVSPAHEVADPGSGTSRRLELGALGGESSTGEAVAA